MDRIDRQICGLLQEDGRATNAEIAEVLGVSVSTASDRVRRLISNGTIKSFQARIDTRSAGADFCCFLLIDMVYDGEQAAVEALSARPEVLELHHISGPHSYLAKIRVSDASALEAFLQEAVKPLAAVHRTETFFSMSVRKETSAVKITPPGQA